MMRGLRGSSRSLVRSREMRTSMLRSKAMGTGSGVLVHQHLARLHALRFGGEAAQQAHLAGAQLDLLVRGDQVMTAEVGGSAAETGDLGARVERLRLDRDARRDGIRVHAPSPALSSSKVRGRT